MKKLAALFLILVLTIKSFPPSVIAAQVPADCQMCGHVCCCPAICEAKIKEQKEQRVGCGTSMCRLDSSSSPRELASAKETSAPSFLDSALFANAILTAHDTANAQNDQHQILSQNLASDIPTPPPRLLS